ncbi:MAG TPA: cupredoxin domain-containing protein [Myxococcales bacterium]
MNAIVAALLLAAAPAPRVIQLSVTDNGFEPQTVTAKKGEKLRLVVTRKTEHTCAKEVHIKDAGIARKLPLNVPVEIDLTPARAGQLRYACSMDMVAGALLIE